jgi:hypothetical protein
MSDVTLQVIQSPVLTLQVLQDADAPLVVTQTGQVSLEAFAAPAMSLEVTQVAPMSLEVIYGIQGPQGAQGAAGIPEEDMTYSERTDFVGETYIYRGQALPGTSEFAPFWRIRRLTIGADDDVKTEWADGDANFNNTWADREALSYA